MASITSLGTGSGVLTSKLVDDLVAAERKATESRITVRQTRQDALVSEYGALKSLVAKFQTAAASLGSATALKGKKATSSGEAMVTATASTLAQSGSYSVSVSQLAQSQSLASRSFANVNDVVGTGVLSFTFGTTASTYDPANPATYSFTADAERTTKTVSIASGNSSLVGIRDAVNAANIGVQASLVNDGSGYRLVFASSSTGAENSFQIGVSGATGSLGDLRFDTASVTGGTNQTAQSLAAKDALLSVNGLAVSRPSNLVTEVIGGVTLNLKQTTSGPVTISVGQDTDAITKKMDDFVAAYNELKTRVNEATTFDPDTKTAGLLLGDSAVTTMMSQMRRKMSELVSGLAGAGVRSMSDIGISTNAKTGLLSFDSSTFSQKLASSGSDVAALLAADGRPTDPLVSYSSSTSATKAGQYALNITQLATQAQYQGATVPALAGPITVDATNSSFKIRVNGTTSATLQLTEQVYATGDDLAAEISRQINNDATLLAAGAGVTVAFNSTDNRFEISSNKYGSLSSVSLVAVDDASAATLGLSTGSTATGKDVAGTIGGVAGNGVGQSLYASSSSDAAGLALKITGGSTGDRGSITFVRGVASSLSQMLDSFLSDNGVIGNKMTGLNKQQEQINTQRQAMEARSSALRKRLEASFSYNDALVSKLTSSGDFIKRQLDMLAGVNSNK